MAHQQIRDFSEIVTNGGKHSERKKKVKKYGGNQEHENDAKKDALRRDRG